MISCFSYEVQPIHYQGSCCERLFQFPKEPINNQFIWEHEVCLGLGVLFFMFNNTNRTVNAGSGDGSASLIFAFS